MSSEDLIRWSGLAAMVGGTLSIIGELLNIFTYASREPFSGIVTTAPYIVESLLFLLGAVLVLFALFGLYNRQSQAAGSLGVVGFLAPFLGTALWVAIHWAYTFIVPYLAGEAPEVVDAGFVPFAFPLSALIFSLGWLLFGLAALRARVYPRVAAVLLMVGAILGFIPLPLGTVPLFVAVAWLGYTLFAGKDAPAGQPSRVS